MNGKGFGPGGHGSDGGEGGEVIHLDLEHMDLSRLGGTARLIALGALVFGLVAAAGWALSFRVDWLWFEALGHEAVLLEVVFTQVGLFLLGFIGFVVLGGANLALAFRTAAVEIRPGSTSDKARRALSWLGAVITTGLGVVLGNGLAGSWETVLLWLNAESFGQQDPVFGHDLGFYVFSLPFFELVRVWLLGAVFLSLALAVAAYALLSRLPRPPFARGSDRPRLHVAALGSALLVLMAVGHWLGRYMTLYSGRGAVYGVGYTQDHATIPAYGFMAVVALLAAAGLLFAAWSGRRRAMLASVLGWVAVAFLALSLYPELVQRFQVEPSELARERGYLAGHIAATRQAYGLDRIEVRSHPARGEIDAATIAANQGTVQNVRLWDEGPLRQSYNQIQFFRLYYDFLRVFTDRYDVDGELRQVMLSTRELSPEKLPQEAQRWVNRHLQFTHGYGVAMSPVTEVAQDGRPAFLLSDLPPQGVIELTRPEIYYGLKSLDYVIANTRMEEFSYPGPDGPVYSHYEGEGGVAIGGFLRRALYAWHFGDVNLLISDEIEPESRIQYHRTVPERVARLAPFLRLDRSPYAVVADGGVHWIQDAYTVTNRYPYSLPWREGGFNYIRNSVKAVVNAYDGAVQLYVSDPDDPIVRAYDTIFPGLFLPMEQLPEALRSHVRVPRDIFSVQVQMLLQYHMQDPTVFYNKEDQWSLPQETSFQQSRTLEPYYIVARLPEETEEEFLLIQPFTPNNRHNLVAWIAARNDGDGYGELALYRFPSGRHVDGPNQVEARIDNDPVISEQFTLWGQVGSEVSRGNLLVIPLGDAIFYAEPIFLRPETLEFPELRRIILADSRTVVMQPTLDRAVAALVGELPAVASPEETARATAADPAAAAAEALGRDASGMSRTEMEELARSLEQTIRQLQQLLERLRGQGGSGSDGP